MSETRTTRSRRKIQKWTESRGGRPARLRGGAGEPGSLCIHFPGYEGSARPVEISWDDFFKQFGEQKLTFVYQETTDGGRPSRFYELLQRKTRKRARAAGT